MRQSSTLKDLLIFFKGKEEGTMVKTVFTGIY
jgi:hypothetical protein